MDANSLATLITAIAGLVGAVTALIIAFKNNGKIKDVVSTVHGHEDKIAVSEDKIAEIKEEIAPIVNGNKT
jgi:hypothetical protein